MCRPYNWLIIFEMIPESIELGGWVILLGGIAIGLVLFQSIHLLMDKLQLSLIVIKRYFRSIGGTFNYQYSNS